MYYHKIYYNYFKLLEFNLEPALNIKGNIAKGMEF